jgi:hypothetical protein
MTDPVDPARFAHPDDVSARWILGNWTAPDTTDWDAWAQERIVDVEAELLGLVKSLQTFDPATDPRRARAVKTLVVDKVTELRANPRGVANVNQSMDGFLASEQTRANTTSQAIWFSEQELDSVRVSVTRRRFGTIYVGPGPYACP